MCLSRRVHDVHQGRDTLESRSRRFFAVLSTHRMFNPFRFSCHRVSGMIHLDGRQMNVIGIYIEAAQHRLDRLYLFSDKLRSRSVIAYQGQG